MSKPKQIVSRTNLRAFLDAFKQVGDKYINVTDKRLNGKDKRDFGQDKCIKYTLKGDLK